MKKVKFLITMLALSVMGAFPVYAANVKGCSGALGSNIQIDTKFTTITHTIILIIQIAVPVILVIFGMMDLMKGVMAQKEDEIKKGQQMFIKRLVAAAIIFFVVAIVKLIFTFVADDKGGNMLDCANCFINGTNAAGNCKKR